MKTIVKINSSTKILEEGKGRGPRPGSLAAEIAEAIAIELAKRDKRTTSQKVLRAMRAVFWFSIYMSVEVGFERLLPHEYEKVMKYIDIRRYTTWTLRRWGMSHWPGFSHMTGDEEPTDIQRKCPWCDDPDIMKEMLEIGTEVIKTGEALLGHTPADDPARKDRLSTEYLEAIEKGNKRYNELQKIYGSEKEITCPQRPEGLPANYGFGLKNPFVLYMADSRTEVGKKLEKRYEETWVKVGNAVERGQPPNPDTCDLLSYMIWGPIPGGKK